MAIKNEHIINQSKQPVQIFLSNIKRLLLEIVEQYPDNSKFKTERFFDSDGFRKSIKEIPYFAISLSSMNIDHKKNNGLGSNRPVLREFLIEYVGLLEAEGSPTTLEAAIFMEYLYMNLSERRHEIYKTLPSGELPVFGDLNFDNDIKNVDGKQTYVRKISFLIRTCNHNVDGSVGRNPRV